MNSSFLHHRALVCATSLLLIALVVASVAKNRSEKANVPQQPLYWAYCPNPPADAPAPADPPNTLQHVPNSTAVFTLAQIDDLFSVPDWHPASHPPMPDIVGQGSKPDVYACGYCHLPNGLGRPENSGIAGLPADYIIQQMADFKSGARKSAEPSHLPVTAMVGVATHATDQQTRTAAAYFAALKPKPWIRVVEVAKVPKTHVAGWMLVVSQPPADEPIGHRIIEIPENLERTELRDDTSGFIAYVPPGSLKKGQSLVATGGKGKTVPCASCHGLDLRGLNNVPSIAGRSPSYTVRQLYDLQKGFRAGAGAQLMKAPVEKLTLDDIIAIAAYTSSLQP
jgi:cytochrome c553